MGTETAARRTRSRDAAGGRRRRVPRWVKALVALAVLAIVLVVLDRAAEIVTARRLAERIQTAQHLSMRPRVSIGGWPFLTQVASGSYDDVTISSSAPIGANGVAVSDADVYLHGVKVSALDALHGTVANVPVKSGYGTAVLTYRELDRVIARYVPSIGSQLTVVGMTAGHARIKGPFGLALDVTAKVAGGKLTVSPSQSELSGLPELVRGPIQQALSHPYRLPPFPFNVRLTGATLEPGGVHLRATAHNSVFPIR